MPVWEILIASVALSMDALAVAICKGLSFREYRTRYSVLVGVYFGSFQAVMPLIGYFAAGLFADEIVVFDHWIAFGLLLFIGARMVKESFEDSSCAEEDASVALRCAAMLALSVATSIDALAMGVTFAFLAVDIWTAAALIGATTFIFSAAGVKMGSVFGVRFKSKAERLGGAILILMGVKILLEHLNVL